MACSGIFAAIALVAGVGTCFWINQYVGLAAAITLVVLMPFATALWVKVWPHTPAGRRLILGPPVAPDPGAHETTPPQPGQVGVVVSELRPGGLCEFSGTPDRSPRGARGDSRRPARRGGGGHRQAAAGAGRLNNQARGVPITRNAGKSRN